MFTTSRVSAILIILAVVGSAEGGPVLWSPAEGGNGHYYCVRQLTGPDLSWAAARDAAAATAYEGMIGHLATVASAGENEFITSLLQPHNVGIRYAWLGAYQADPYGLPGEAWAWITGEPWTYTNWAAGEPNDYAGIRESWLAVWGTTGNDASGTWNDEGYYLAEGWYVTEYDTPSSPCPFTLYVDVSAQGTKSGRSWADAYTDLQAALDEAAQLNCGLVQIWVADGIYRPSKQVLPGDRRSATFQMSNDLSLYGGFAGGETSLAQRKPFENLTILSGDLDADDPPPVLHPYGPTINPQGPNTYWVVGGESLNASALLDGFVVRDGDDVCYGGPDCGYTGGSGGGIFIKSGSPRIANCTVINNRGAGISLSRGANPMLVNCRFLGNQWAGLEGYGSYPVFVNCIFTGHQTAIFVDHSWPKLVNCTLTGNEQAIMFDGNASIAVYNSIIWGNLTDPYPSGADSIADSCVPSALLTGSGYGNISTDPEFINPTGADGVYGTLDDDVRLSPNSACVDVGNNWRVQEVQDAADLDSDGLVAEELPLDLAFQPRRADTQSKPDGATGLPPIVDMGAYENPAEPTPWRLYVKAGAEGVKNGTNWVDAFVDLQSALDVAERSGGAITEIWVTAAGYKPTKATSTDPRSATFKLVSGVTIYGGFMGWETSLDHRDVPENVTYLSGDLQDNDMYEVGNLARCVNRNDSPRPLGPGCEVFDFDHDQDVDGDDVAKAMQSPDKLDNAYHVVTAVNTREGTVLDGIAIVSGVGGEGAGIWAEASNLALRHCQIGFNLAGYSGSALMSRNGTHTLTGCTFWNNCAGYEGGGVDLYGGAVVATGCTFANNGGVSGGSGINLFRTPATLAQCAFTENVAGYSGAGVRAYEGTLSVTDCLFTDNVAGYSGAGLDAHGTTVEVSRCTFTSNQTRNGGGINANGGGENLNRHLRVINCTFRDNSAAYAGGALNLFRTGMSIVNCAFVNNHADYSGGGIDEYETSPSLVNCSFIGNSASFGSAIRNFRCSPALTNCLVWNNTPRSIADEDAGQSIITYSDLQEPVPGTSNISRDPKLRDVAAGDIRLSDGSPCIDAGNNAVALGPDLAGQARFVDDPFTANTGTGTPPIVDIGAYEYYPDCNRNEVDDHQDIAAGTSIDCNANGTPDECEPDCNHNGIADACDLASGTSQDCDQNGVPDECDPDCDGNGIPDACEMGVGNFRMLVFHLDPTNNDWSRNGAIEQPAFYQPPSIEAVVRWPGMCMAPPSAVEGAHLTLFPNPQSPWTQYDGGPFLNPPAENFGVELRAMLLVSSAQAGPITFEFGADDLALLRIDEHEGYINEWFRTQKVTWVLAPGSHELVFRMVEFGGGADIRLGWDADNKGQPRVCIPSSAISLLADCNHNGIPDSCDIRNGTSKDCNNNGSPDECDILAGLEQDCDENGVLDSCDLASGAAQDCNHTGIPDACEIAWGGSQDCNNNQIPDECDIAAGTELDCNHNGVPDRCDIAAGTSPDANQNGVPDECEPPPCAATRNLPAGYVPGVKLTVTIEAKPAAGVAAYAVQDPPPAGWTVGAINESGGFDVATGKVKWGPFLDNRARTLTYEATPPANAQGQQCFGPGAISLDGQTAEICGPSCVSPCFDHPADTNGDRRLVIDEVTAYAAAWRRGQVWPVPPNPIPIGYVTRAGMLWKGGETYGCDFGQAPPLLWINVPSSVGPIPSELDNNMARALRHITPSGDGYQVAIDVQANLAAAYAVEETPPTGWTLSGISEDGTLDPATGQIRWGPFFDGANRQLVYHVVPTDGQLSRSFAGQLSTDGRDQAVAGSRMAAFFADLDSDSDVDSEDLARFGNCVSGPAVLLTGTSCSQADFDQDGDVDQVDFSAFQRCFSGQGQPFNERCAE